MPSLLMAPLQGVVCCALLYVLLAAPVAGYALRFTAVAFFLMSMYVTQVGGACGTP